MNNDYRNSQKYLSASFYIAIIVILLNIITLGIGILMKTTDLIGWEIVFYCMITILGICNTLSLVLCVLGVKRLKEEENIERFMDKQDKER